MGRRAEAAMARVRLPLGLRWQCARREGDAGDASRCYGARAAVAKEARAVRIRDDVAFMAGRDADRAAAFGLCETTRVAVVPVLLGEIGAGRREGAHLGGKDELVLASSEYLARRQALHFKEQRLTLIHGHRL